eukprot:TRINITY_DN14532_c0_g1_i5.p1 TRINITY_DN14532_c0_g1~~TRINITY_DN14532_c0_g1_i5.p1  ORF type:complete len:419 (+),score=63.66 TRINITY_DN14532_c0_g1_i5:318-1574(+)
MGMSMSEMMEYFKELSSYIDSLDRKLDIYARESEQVYLTIYQKFIDLKNHELVEINKEFSNTLNENIKLLYGKEIKSNHVHLKMLNKKLHTITSCYEVLENDNKKQRAELVRMNDENEVLRLQLKTRIETSNKLQLLMRVIGQLITELESDIASSVDIEKKYNRLVNAIKYIGKAIANCSVDNMLPFDLPSDLSPHLSKSKPIPLQTPSVRLKRTATIDSKPFLEETYKKRMDTLAQKNEALERQIASLRARMGSAMYQRRDLEEIFIDCINSVKKNIYKRKLKSTIANDLSVRLVNSRLKAVITKEIASTVDKIRNKSENSESVKYKEFTSEDKQNLLTLFVCNERIIEYIHDILFIKYDNLALNFIYSPSKATDCSREELPHLYSTAKKILETSPTRNRKGCKSVYRRKVSNYSAA